MLHQRRKAFSVRLLEATLYQFLTAFRAKEAVRKRLSQRLLIGESAEQAIKPERQTFNHRLRRKRVLMARCVNNAATSDAGGDATPGLCIRSTSVTGEHFSGWR
jgi:hypothetical protein